MSVGITSTGVYVPYNRLKRDVMGKSWERKGLKGERSVANTDEDSLTMATEAAINSLNNIDRNEIDALYFASLTAPYAEKLHATTIATACDLNTNAFTVDFGFSTKAGTSALKAALDAVSGGTSKKAVVTAADCRIGYPKSDQEQLYGDASAAMVVGTENIIAELKEFASVNNEIIDIWRNYGEIYNNLGEGRFISTEGYKRSMNIVCKNIMKKANMEAKDFAKVILASPGLKDNQSVAKKLGFTDEQMQDNLMLEVGDCGTAQPLMLLASALEQAKPGDKLLLAAYGNGADAFIFEVTENINNFRNNPSIAEQLENKKYLESYTRYLSFRGLVDAQPGEPFRTFPSNAGYWREQNSILRMHGSKCKECGTTAFPITRVCYKCRSKDNFESICLSKRKAKIFTFSIDNLAGRSDDPVVVQTVAEDSEGTRYYLLLTDFNKDEVKVGLEVEFTFRMIYEGGNYNNYYWKCRPVRKGGDNQ